jgi:Ser/Thr protein kinase RdoA (MazF antagonist)
MQMTAKDQIRRMEAAARNSLQHWNLAGAELELLKYRENAVYRVTSGDGKFALRVHRPGYHADSALRSELEWIKALATAGIEVPRILPTQSGDLFALCHTPDMPTAVQVDLFEWIEGRQLGSVESGLENDRESICNVYRTIGELAAALHNHSATWKPPAGFDRHAWDEHGLTGEQPFWGRFWELDVLTPGQRKLLSTARDRVFRDLAALPKGSDTYSMIHADFAPENLLVEGERIRLIDFDDSGFGWYLFELVTSLYFIMNEAYFDEAKEALISGYRMHRSLDDKELELLPLFFLARSFTYVGWVHTRPGTETAEMLTPMLVEMSCELSESYLAGEGQ